MGTGVERRLVRCVGVTDGGLLCNALIVLPAGVAPAEGGNVCAACAERIDRTIARRISRHTGRVVGGLTLADGKIVARQG